jgi:calcineurin-like phosphoesterase family protein
MSKKFYISDYHFYHQLALDRSRSTEFNSIEDMNNQLIKRHNNKVGMNDDVYILGDVIVCSKDNLEEYLLNTVAKLNGHLHLIVGNHDNKFINNKIFRSYFESINDTLYLNYSKYKVVLFHYPILFWYKKQKSSYHIYGHIHDDRSGYEIKILFNEPKALNACVEVNNYEPCTLKELEINNTIFRETIDI